MSIGLNPSGCCCGGCLHRHLFRGCASLGSPGLTVNLWDSSAKATLYATGATDSTGLVELTGPTTAYVEVPAGQGYAAFGASSTCSPTTQFHGLTPAADYYCFSIGSKNCPNPVYKTLYFSSPYWGNATLTYNAGVWIGGGTLAFPGCASPLCPAADVPFTVRLQPGPVNKLSIASRVGGFSGHTCPVAATSNGSAQTQDNALTASMLSCGPFVISGSVAPALSDACHGASTFTITQ